MKKNALFLLVAGLTLVGCKSDNGAPARYNEYNEYAEFTTKADCGTATKIRYSMPNGNDLKLETPRHVIQIDAQPGVNYEYYVWTGDKTYDDDPDLIVQDGVAAVLVEQ